MNEANQREHHLELLRKELRLAGVKPKSLFPRWAGKADMRNALLGELLVALNPTVHEGLIAPYGSIVIPPDSPLDAPLIDLSDENLELARKAADGSSALRLFQGSTFKGLVLVDPAGTPELELARIVDHVDGVGFRRDRRGVVRLYGRGGTVRCAGRQWSLSPPVEEAVESVMRVAPMANRRLLRELLDFAYHVLSAWHVGVTLVWLLSPDDPFGNAVDLQPLRLSISPDTGEPSLSFAAHLLAQYDGATIISPDGCIKATGIHLTPSSKAEQLIDAFSGTRHTSACRASYDHANTLIVTVSVDGPVTIYSDGKSIFSLSWFSADKVAGSIRRMMGRERKGDVWISGGNAVCQNCGKTSEIEVVTVAGFRGPEEASCPVCGTVIAERHCYDVAANLKKVF